jgi:uncharacterized repeat protein (TIGR02543 family)
VSKKRQLILKKEFINRLLVFLLIATFSASGFFVIAPTYSFAGETGSNTYEKVQMTDSVVANDKLSKKNKVKKFTIRFKVNGGKALGTQYKKTIKYKAKLGKLPNPTRKGYKFAGWWTARTGGKRVYSSSVANNKAKKTFYAHWSKVNTLPPPPVVEQKYFRVLAIGSSFSRDSMHYLYKIAADSGYTDIVFGNLFTGGLKSHRKYADTGEAAYIYQKTVDDVRSDTPDMTFEYGLKDEAWDFIILQQDSERSGQVDTYNDDINALIDYINLYKRNPNAKIAWHLTWAYQSDSDYNGFNVYGNDQMAMYEAICTAVQTKIVPNANIDIIIPAGTALQNMRTGILGDTITSDGRHAAKGAPMYLLGLSWMKALTGVSIDNAPGIRNSYGISQEVLKSVIRSVNDASVTPFSVTYQ